MISIDKSTAMEFLERDIYKNLLELHAIEQNVYPIMDRFFADTKNLGAVMLVAESWAVLSGYEGTFLAECLNWLNKKFAKFILLSTDKRIFNSQMAESHQLEFGKIGHRRSFVCKSIEQIPVFHVNGGRLTKSDEDAVRQYPEKSDGGNPGLSQFFECFVLDNKGEVFVIKEKGEIIAYLSCAEAYKNIWDVHFVHVREDKRNQGVGTQVAILYAREMLMQNRIPYYSSAINVASEKIADKSGFTCCREMFSTEAMRME